MKISFAAGVLGIKVKIMLPWDPTGKSGPKRPLPDNVSVVEPKDEIYYTSPDTDYRNKPTGIMEDPALVHGGLDQPM